MGTGTALWNRRDQAPAAFFIWRCTGYMSLWSAEYAAAFRDDAAYEMTDAMCRALKQEETLWSRGRPFRWTELNGFGPGFCPRSAVPVRPSALPSGCEQVRLSS